MEVFYDSKHDVVSIYFDRKEVSAPKETNRLEGDLSKRSYEVDEAAGLILDMVDLVDESGSAIGFRVFNASRYYDIELLNSAEAEVLSEKEMGKAHEEKIIAQFSPKHNLIVTKA